MILQYLRNDLLESPVLGLEQVVPVVPIPMSRPAVQALLPFTFAAAQSIISKGIKAITSPVGLLSIATAASVGMIVWAGTAYFDLKKAEAEAAANTAADVWYVTNPQECHAGDTTGHFRITAVTESGELFYHGAVLETIRKHLDNICNYFLNRTSSGVMEGINNRIKLIKRQGSGFANFLKG